MIDFLIRHGLITKDKEQDFFGIQKRSHGSFDYEDWKIPGAEAEFSNTTEHSTGSRKRKRANEKIMGGDKGKAARKDGDDAEARRSSRQ